MLPWVSPGRQGRALPVEVQQLKSSPRYGYKPSPLNGCVSPLCDDHLTVSISSLTKCWNHHTGAMRPGAKANTTVVRSSRVASPGSSEMGREHKDQLRCSGMWHHHGAWFSKPSWTASEWHAGVGRKKLMFKGGAGGWWVQKRTEEYNLSWRTNIITASVRLVFVKGSY